MNQTAPADPLKAPTAKTRYEGLYKGKIVQRTDPSRLGRLRVSVEGVHTNVSVENLPWAWPCTPAFQKGGFFAIPPLDEYVWVMFEAGMADYPVWLGGWWGAPTPQTVETADGYGASAHRELPTNNFGGGRREAGLLRMESMPGLRPEDQPNNYTWASPLQKYWEFDDRKGLEKVKVADQLDNYFWINTQRGTATWEMIQGLDSDVQTRRYRGITLNNFDEVVQIYTFKGWLLTIDDKYGGAELTSPTGFKLRLDETTQRAELWTAAKNYLVLDDAAQRIDLRTTAGRTLMLDDAGQHIRLSGVNNENYLCIDENLGVTELRTAGTLNLKAVGDLNIASGGIMSLSADEIHLNSEVLSTSKDLIAINPYAPPTNAVLATKADVGQRNTVPQ